MELLLRCVVLSGRTRPSARLFTPQERTSRVKRRMACVARSYCLYRKLYTPREGVRRERFESRLAMYPFGCVTLILLVTLYRIGTDLWYQITL